MHNGFLQVEGEKMSKSLGNFVTIRELLADWRGRAWAGNAVRLAMIGSHYRAPIDWSQERLADAERELVAVAEEFFSLWANRFNNETVSFTNWLAEVQSPQEKMLEVLADDLNTPAALSAIRAEYGEIAQDAETASKVLSSLELLGVVDRRTLFLNGFPILRGFYDPEVLSGMNLAGRRLQIALLNKDETLPDDIASLFGEGKVRVELGPGSLPILIRDRQDVDRDRNKIDELISARAAARARKDFKESDRIRDELAAMGIVLKDSKDPVTGEPKTTWEIAR
jgi:cysteinyl-tRNA synthetase